VAVINSARAKTQVELDRVEEHFAAGRWASGANARRIKAPTAHSHPSDVRPAERLGSVSPSCVSRRACRIRPKLLAKTRVMGITPCTRSRRP